MEDVSTLREGELHPSAAAALKYILNLPFETLTLYKEVFSSLAIEGNRTGEVCLGTLKRIEEKAPISDKYILGLAFAMLTAEVMTRNKLEKERLNKDMGGGPLVDIGDGVMLDSKPKSKVATMAIYLPDRKE